MRIAFHRFILSVLIILIGSLGYTPYALFKVRDRRGFFPEEYLIWGGIIVAVFIFSIWILGLGMESLFNGVLIPIWDIKTLPNVRNKLMRKMIVGILRAFIAPGLYLMFIFASALAPGVLLAITLSFLL